MSDTDDLTTMESEDSDEASDRECSENASVLSSPLVIQTTPRKYENPDTLIEVALGSISDLQSVSNIDHTFVSSVTLLA